MPESSNERDSRRSERRVDPVTSLPRLAAALADIARSAHALKDSRCLGVVDFNVLRDAALFRLTHEADTRLRADITRRLMGALRPQDRLYSAGRWEWLIVLEDMPSGAPMTMAMVRLDALFADPLLLFDGNYLSLKISCGGALCPDDGDNPRHLVQSARIAALAASQNGTHYASYEPSMEPTDPTQLQLHTELPRALAGIGGLSLYLQPQVNLANGLCVGCEGLLRWVLPSGERIDPNRTLAAVERLGLRGAFTRWLLQQAMQTQTRLRDEGIDILLSVNLSGNDLLDPELPDLMTQTLETWSLPADCLLLELTETLMIEDTEQVMEVLNRLRAMGFSLSVDDFGTGYASMSYLQRLPVQEVKIDQSFVRQAESSTRDREIIASLIQLAHRLNLIVVAEGIETPQIGAIIGGLGCDRGQGYLYGKGMPVEEFVPWWRSRHERLRAENPGIDSAGADHHESG